MSNKNKRIRKTVRKGTAKGKGFVISELSRINPSNPKQETSNPYTAENLFFDLVDCDVQVISYIDY